MIRINGSALISLGEILQDLLHVKPHQPAKENLLPLLGGGILLANFLARDNAFQLRVSQKKGQELQQCLDKLGQKKLPDELNHTDVAILTRLVNDELPPAASFATQPDSASQSETPSPARLRVTAEADADASY